jgi:hypothetical protein
MLLVLMSAIAVGSGIGIYFLVTKWPAHAGSSTKLGERFLGNWQGVSAQDPSMSIDLDVTVGRITVASSRLRTGSKANENLAWKVVQTSGNTLVIRQERAGGKTFDWSIEFTSADAIQITSLVSNKPIGNFTRAGTKNE